MRIQELNREEEMNFKEHCTEASLSLQKLEEIVNQLEDGMLLLEGCRSKEEDALISALIALFNKASEHISNIRNHLIIIREEPSVGYAIHVAMTELSKRAVNVRMDMDRYFQKPGVRDNRENLRPSVAPN